MPEATKGFRIEKGDAAQLITYLSSIAYDGGTNLSAVELTRERLQERELDRAKTPPPIAYYLLFTDVTGDSFTLTATPVNFRSPVNALRRSRRW